MREGRAYKKEQAREFHGWQEMQRGDGTLTLRMAELLDRVRVLSSRLDRAPEGSRRYHRIFRKITSCQEEYRRRQMAERTERNRRSGFTGKRIRKMVRFIMEDDFNVSV